MEKLQLKMRMLNVALTEEGWRAFDLLIKLWQKIGVKDETFMNGSIMSAGVDEVMDDVLKIKNHDPEMLDKIKDIEINKGGINEMFDVTI